MIAVVLMVAEAFVPSFGGLAAFVLAAVILFDTEIPGFGMSWPVIPVLLIGFIATAIRIHLTSSAKNGVHPPKGPGQ